MCVSYESDFELFSLLYDIALASQISGVVAMADKNKIAPEEAASNMQNFDSYWLKEQEKLEDICRQHKQQARQQHASNARAEEDEIRERAQRGESRAQIKKEMTINKSVWSDHDIEQIIQGKPIKLPDMDVGQGMPNAFLTIAPAEWKFNWHRGVQQWRKEVGCSLSDGQAIMTLHMHHVIGTVLKEVLLKKGTEGGSKGP